MPLTVQVGEFIEQDRDTRGVHPDWNTVLVGILRSVLVARNVLVCRTPAGVDVEIIPSQHVHAGTPLGKHVYVPKMGGRNRRGPFEILDLIDGRYRLMDVGGWVSVTECVPMEAGVRYPGLPGSEDTPYDCLAGGRVSEVFDRLLASPAARPGDKEVLDEIFSRLEMAETDSVYWKEKYHGTWDSHSDAEGVVKWAAVDRVTGMILGVWGSRYQALGLKQCRNSRGRDSSGCARHFVKVVPVLCFPNGSYGHWGDIEAIGKRLAGWMWRWEPVGDTETRKPYRTKDEIST